MFEALARIEGQDNSFNSFMLEVVEETDGVGTCFKSCDSCMCEGLEGIPMPLNSLISLFSLMFEEIHGIAFTLK